MSSALSTFAPSRLGRERLTGGGRWGPNAEGEEGDEGREGAGECGGDRTPSLSSLAREGEANGGREMGEFVYGDRGGLLPNDGEARRKEG